MRKIVNWVKENPNRTMFLLPIILVAGISISHVVSWYDIANPINWAIYLSIAIEVGAMTALVAATNRIKGGVWFMFGLITMIQMIGNIFYSFKEIDANGELFKSWVELTGPIWEMIGSDTTDVVAMKRWLAFLEGGLLPIISLTSLHFFVKYDNGKKEEIKPLEVEEVVEEEVTEDYNTRLQKDAQKVFETIKQLKEEGKLSEPTKEEIEEEPAALAFTPYEVEESIENEEQIEEDEQPNLVEEENPEDEIILQDEKVSNTETTVVPIRNVGEELNKTWRNIVKKRNNNIGRITE